jgi:hypothetical protein
MVGKSSSKGIDSCIFNRIKKSNMYRQEDAAKRRAPAVGRSTNAITKEYIYG